MAMKAIHAIVHGRVQGVFFRDYTRKQAEQLALAGWVRNLPDGTVETVAQGEETEVNRFLAWLETGSPHSRVSRVESREEPLDPERISFSIRW